MTWSWLVPPAADRSPRAQAKRWILRLWVGGILVSLLHLVYRVWSEG
jgi:hypothetical protein